MGKQRRRATQASMWVATQDLPRSAAHPFYRRLNQILERAAFDAYVERLCRRFYADEVGRPGLAPGRYVRMLLLGYFEGLDSERAIAWRAADSLSVRSFLGLELHAAPPDHSTVSRPRRLIDIETHQAVFTWVLQRLAAANLVKGKTIGIDATTLEANAALRSIVRRDTGAGYEECLTRLAQASGIATPTREDVARRDRQRKHKGSNDDWQHPYDPDAKITKMKDGRTHHGLGDHAAARGAYTRSLSLNSQAGYVLNNLCFLAYSDGDYDEAAEHCEAAVRVDPSLRQAFNNLALVYFSTGRDGLGWKALQDAGPIWSAIYNLGVLHMARGDHQAAAATFTAVSRVKPNWAAARRRAKQAKEQSTTGNIRRFPEK